MREMSGKYYFCTRSGKSQGIQVLQNCLGNFKYQDREKSGNFLILAQNCLAVAGILSILSD